MSLLQQHLSRSLASSLSSTLFPAGTSSTIIAISNSPFTHQQLLGQRVSLLSYWFARLCPHQTRIYAFLASWPRALGRLHVVRKNWCDSTLAMRRLKFAMSNLSVRLHSALRAATETCEPTRRCCVSPGRSPQPAPSRLADVAL